MQQQTVSTVAAVTGLWNWRNGLARLMLCGHAVLHLKTDQRGFHQYSLPTYWPSQQELVLLRSTGKSLTSSPLLVRCCSQRTENRQLSSCWLSILRLTGYWVTVSDTQRHYICHLVPINKIQTDRSIIISYPRKNHSNSRPNSQFSPLMEFNNSFRTYARCRRWHWWAITDR